MTFSLQWIRASTAVGGRAKATSQCWPESEETKVPIHAFGDLIWSYNWHTGTSSPSRESWSDPARSYPKKCSWDKIVSGIADLLWKFMPNLSTQLAPLYKVLGKNIKWTWSPTQDWAFIGSKKLLTSSRLLIYFNSELPLMLACDASVNGIGAVLEKEGLSCVFLSQTLLLVSLRTSFLANHRPQTNSQWTQAYLA